MPTVLSPAAPVSSRAAAPAAVARDRTLARAAMTVAGIAAALLLISRVGYVPMWDGHVYANAITEAADQPFHPARLRLAGHASHAYAGLAIAAQSLAPGGYWPLLVVNTLLLGTAVVAFRRLVRLAFPAPEWAVDRALLTGAFMLQPTLLAAVVQPGLDLPLVPAFLWCAVLLLERRGVWMVLVGLALVFTKETGALLYGVLLATYGIWLLARTSGGVRTRALAVLRLAPLAAPVVVFALYLAWRRFGAPPGEEVVWNAGTGINGQSLLRQFIVPRVDRYLVAYLAIMLVLNFAWISTVISASGAIAAARRIARSGGWRAALRETVRMVATVPGFLVLLTLGTAYALTRFATYANSRYLLPVIALLPLPFLAALLTLPIRVRLRRAILAAFVAVLLASTVRTIDPVSRAVFGTFRFGDHRMLRMTSITHECCAAGRDQLVYSLEFTMLDALTNDALAAIVPGDSTLLVVPDSTNWHVVKRVERSESRRTLRAGATHAPLVVETDSAALFAKQRRKGYYIAMPNGSVTLGHRQLEHAFEVGAEVRVRRGGYWLSLYPLTVRTEPLSVGTWPHPRVRRTTVVAHPK